MKNVQEQRNLIRLLVAEDDPDDRLLIKRAATGSGTLYKLFFVSNGIELLDFLYHRGPYDSPSKAPRPDLILLDLNMPKQDGRSALSMIKEDKGLTTIPVVVFSTSSDPSDVGFAQRIGAKSFIKKPGSFREFKAIISSLSDFC